MRLYVKGIICITLLWTVFFISGCGTQETEESPAIDPIEITVSINYPHNTKLVDVEKELFRIEEDSTVLQIIELYGNVHDLPILVETTNSTLEGISSIHNGVYAKDGQWRYKVNGDIKGKAVDKMIIDNGDHLEFFYDYTEKDRVAAN